MRLTLRKRDLFQWHRWFAWFPVRVGASDVRWLEVVERKFECFYEGYFGAQYRAAGSGEPR